MARQSTPPTDSPDAESLWLGIFVSVIAVLLLGVVVGYGPLMALAPSPGDSGERWSQVQSIDTGPSNGAELVVTVTYRTGGPKTESTQQGTNQYTVEGVNPAQVDAAGDWAYLPKSTLPPPLVAADGNHSAGVQTVGPWVLVGTLSAATTVLGGSSVTVLAPTAMDVDPARKARFLSTFVSPYQLRPIRGEPATLLVAPDSLASDGVTYGTTGYVTQHAFWDGEATSVWIHEYIHSQQTFETSPEMAWFREASATYLSARMLEEQYHGVGEGDVRAWIEARDDFTGTTLAEESSWRRSNANYYRGARLLYTVDAEIRAGSDGTHTLIDVFREMNRREELVTVEAFVRIVESHSGQPEPWLRPAITGSGVIDGQVPENGEVFDQ